MLTLVLGMKLSREELSCSLGGLSWQSALIKLVSCAWWLMTSLLLASTWVVTLLSPVLQVEVHSRVQVNVCDIQELCVEDAGAAGWSNAEGCGWAGWRQVQPLHCFPWRLTEGHADHPLHLWDSRHLGVDGQQRSVHQISAGQKFVPCRPVLSNHFK